MIRAEFNQFCQSFPAATHVVQWGESDVWKVGGKLFALCNSDEDPTPGITFKTTPMDYEILRGLPGLRPAPYLASRGMKWIQRYAPTDLSDEQLRDCIRESYRLVVAGLTRKKRSELELS